MGDNTEKWPEGDKSGSDSGVDQMKINKSNTFIIYLKNLK